MPDPTRTARDIDAEIARLQDERAIQTARETVRGAKERTDHYCPQAAADKGFQAWRNERDMRRLLEEEIE